MHVKSKIISASLFMSVLFLTACSGNIEIEQNCIKLASEDMTVADANSLCACAASEMKTGFSKSEQRILSALFSDIAKLTEAGSKASSSEVALIILNSDLDYTQSKALADRFEQKLGKCEP